MADILYLTHRLPYPPNKGDKVRSYHLLRSLAERHRVHLGTFVDDPGDWQHAETVRGYCASAHIARLVPAWARIRSLRSLATGAPLTSSYFRDAGLANWVRRVVASAHIRDAVVFSTAMTSYVDDVDGLRVILDCVDVDSAKWTEYANNRPWPMSALYRREGRMLLAHEQHAVRRAAASFFVTEAEAQLFARLAPACAGRISIAGNGVDADYFSPDHVLASPFEQDEVPIVFTGAMDYWPNADAAQWFASEVLPSLRKRWHRLRFYVVGMRPAASVRRLASSSVVVTGSVPDVRPYLRHAAVVTAPLRIARGIQNKVLEAMAMARPIVVSAACAAGIEAIDGREFRVAAEPSEFVTAIDELLGSATAAAAMGRAARERVVGRYSWSARLRRFGELLGDDRDQDVDASREAHGGLATPAAV